MKSWTYEMAGVPHLKGDPAYNRKITKMIRSTHVPGVRGSATGFAALFDPKKSGVKDPLLVSSTDGVGTKLEIARLQGRHDTIGIDLVAMGVNDLITCAAKPIFFLDYFAAGKFEPRTISEVLKGVAEGCRQAGCALVGGETAIMPGFYSNDSKGRSAQYDIAGFSVGVVDRKKIITGNNIKPGDALLGIESSGFHSNGYSLLRKIFSKKELSGKIGKDLLVPTKIYVKPVLKLLQSLPILGIINITGGGFIDNLPRVLPAGLRASLYKGSWPVPKLFDLVKRSGNISDFHMMHTFNMGIGMVIVLRSKHLTRARSILKQMKLNSWPMGHVTRGQSLEVL